MKNKLGYDIFYKSVVIKILLHGLSCAMDRKIESRMIVWR